MGCSARAWHRPGVACELGRPSAGGARITLSRAASDGAPGMAEVRLEGVRSESQGKILQHHLGGKETTSPRRIQVECPGGDHCARNEAGLIGSRSGSGGGEGGQTRSWKKKSPPIWRLDPAADRRRPNTGLAW